MVKERLLRFASILGLVVLLVSVSSCVPAGEGQSEQGGMSSFLMIGFMVLVLAVLYFIMVRPQRKRMKEHQELLGELKSGDKVVTIGGIYGEIQSMSDDSVVLKIESGATIRISKNSIISKQYG